MGKTTKNWDRKYNGVVVTPGNYRQILNEEGEEKVKFHQKHLKSYLQGKDTFTFGKIFDDKTGYSYPKLHMVNGELIKINLEN